MINNKKVTAIVLVAGSGTRFSKEKNKVLFEVNNKPIMLYSVEKFLQNENIDDLIVVTKASEKQTIEEILSKANTGKTIKIVEGGQTRQESVYNALKNTLSDIVIIHDGARPMIKGAYIDECLKAMQEFDGVSIAVKSKDTIKITDDYGVVLNTTKRANTWVIQTPQCFNREVLLKAHGDQKDVLGITDDCMMLENENYKVKLIEGDYSNIKVTTPDDLELAKQFLNKMD